MLKKLFVRCCEETTGENGDNIWLDEEAYLFRYAGNDKQIYYCPWCGILLDTNLEMSRARCNDPSCGDNSCDCTHAACPCHPSDGT
jgi:hypothetical protein